MSSNLLKFRGGAFSQKDTRVIDTNQLMAQRMEALSVKTIAPVVTEGFQSGIEAEEIDISKLVEDNSVEDEQVSNIIKSNVNSNVNSAETIERKALEEANAMLAEAQNRVEQMREDAMRERDEMLRQAKEQGYEEGQRLARQELEQERRRLEERRKELEAEYDELVDQLEPQFIDTLTDIYEHVFHVDLSTNREILEYLINTAIRKIENSRNFLLHVSKEDYPYVSMRKQQLMGGASIGEVTMEIIEDITLSRNECLIETENGVFDCGLGTQLTEVSKKIKLLAYQNR